MSKLERDRNTTDYSGLLAAYMPNRRDAISEFIFDFPSKIHSALFQQSKTLLNNVSAIMAVQLRKGIFSQTTYCELLLPFESFHWKVSSGN